MMGAPGIWELLIILCILGLLAVPVLLVGAVIFFVVRRGRDSGEVVQTCPHCGTHIREQAVAQCPNCGTALDPGQQ